MANDISSLLANAAQTNADFSAIGKLPHAYWQGRDEAAKNAERDLFRDGLPTNPDGSLNTAAMRNALFKVGSLDKGLAVENLGIQRQQLAEAQRFNQQALQDAPAAASSIPPSPSRSAGTVVAPPLGQGGGRPATQTQQPYQGGDAPGSIVGLLDSAGVPDELKGSLIQQASALTKTDPNVPLDPRRTQVVQQFIQRYKAGPQGAPTPQPPAAEPATADAALDGLVPKGRSVQDHLRLLARGVEVNAQANPAMAKQYQSKIDAIQQAIQPTPDMKNARASGMSLPDYQEQGDRRTADRDVMNKSLLPEVKESRDKASAAVDDIQSIHTAREQLDAPGGIFSGSASSIQLKLAKVASLIGVADSNKIANTEAFGSAMGARVLALVKGLGAGAGISNADRDFAAAMAGGNIKLDETSIRRILDIGEKAARIRIEKHNQYAVRLTNSNDALKGYRDVYRVDTPGPYKPPQSKASISDGAQQFSSPADVMAAVKAGKLKKGDTFVDPTGKRRVVP